MSDAATAPTTPAAPAAPAAPTTEGKRAAALALVKAARGEAATAPAAETPAAPAEGAEAPAPTGDAVETPAAETPAAKDDPFRKRLAALKRERAQARQLAATAQAQLAEIRAQTAAFEEQRKAWQTERTADADARKRDPYAWAKAQGFDFREMAKRAVSEKDNPAPLALDDHPAVRALAAKLEALEAANAELRASHTTSALQGELGEAFAATSADTHPFLHRAFSRHEVMSQAVQLTQLHRERSGRYPAAADVFRALERMHKASHQRLARGLGEAPTPPARSGTAPAVNSAKAAKQQTPPVTNRTASARTSPDAPISPEERRSRAKALLRTHRAGG